MLRSTAAQLWSKSRNLCTAVVNLPVWWVSRFMPKDENLWVFGAWDGKSYCDNSRHFFEWLLSNHPEIDAVWLSPDPALRAKLEARGLPCVSTFSREGYRLSMRAGTAVISNSRTGDLNRFATAGKTFVVQLWHGTPIKKIGFDDTVMSHDRSSVLKRAQVFLNRASAAVFPAQREEIDLLTASSYATISHFETAFRIDRTKIAATGLARTDRMVNGLDLNRSGPRRLIYMPTFRGKIGSTRDALADFDPERADAALRACDAELFLKLHPANLPDAEMLAKIEAAERVHLFECGDIHHHLAMFDLLITDYSSIFTDWVLLDRPVVFFPHDLDDFVRGDRELYYDYDWVTPGPKASSWHSLFDQVAKQLADPNRHERDRDRIRKLFNDHADGRNCDRIFAAIKKARYSRGLGSERP